MATIDFKGGKEYMAKISKLEANVLGKAIYIGAGIVADEIRKNLEQVPTDERHGTEVNKAIGPKKRQLKWLEHNFGIAPMLDDGTGYLHVKIGFKGYNDIRTKRWPNGQPNQMVARSVESGTTWMKKNPFVRKAMTASKQRSVAAMQDSVEKSIKEIMK